MPYPQMNTPAKSFSIILQMFIVLLILLQISWASWHYNMCPMLQVSCINWIYDAAAPFLHGLTQDGTLINDDP